jgi:hypothetical protein
MVSSFLRDCSMVFDGVKSAPRYLMLYADDMQIYLSGDKKNLDVMISALNEDLATILQWSVENELLLNPASRRQF